MEDPTRWDGARGYLSSNSPDYLKTTENEPQPMRPASQIIVMGMCVMVAIVLVLIVVLSAIYTYPTVRDLEVFPLTLLFLFAMIGTPVPLFKIAYFIFRFVMSEPDTNMQNAPARKRAGHLVFKIGIELQAEAFFLLLLPVFVPFLIWDHSAHFLIAYLIALVTTYFAGVFMEFRGEKMVRTAAKQQKSVTEE